jgi:hypothetical protein
MISVVPCWLSTTLTTTIGKAFFITTPAAGAGSLVPNEVLICPSTLKRSRFSMGRAWLFGVMVAYVMAECEPLARQWRD